MCVHKFKFVPHMPSHWFCTFDCMKASKNFAGSDLDPASRRKTGQLLLDEARAKYKNE